MQDEFKKSIKSLWFPLVWEALFVASYLFIWLRHDTRHQNLTLYFMFLFYVGIIVYYHKSFSFREFLKQFTKIKTFLLPAAAAGICIWLIHIAAGKLIPLIPFSQPELRLPMSYASALLDEVIYALTILLLQPVAEELFFRKGLIGAAGRKTLFFAICASLILSALSWSVTPCRMAEALFVAAPMVLFYCLTKNVYVTILVHVIFNIVINVIDRVYDFARIWYS
ncbi:MAG: CPBP family intramembrane metalloprotease [Lachnospiraceae bacterium]|nr:CPBP family intramembrane metalloprotease [Lachnospiraceae bacterium]